MSLLDLLSDSLVAEIQKDVQRASSHQTQVLADLLRDTIFRIDERLHRLEELLMPTLAELLESQTKTASAVVELNSAIVSENEEVKGVLQQILAGTADAELINTAIKNSEQVTADILKASDAIKQMVPSIPSPQTPTPTPETVPTETTPPGTVEETPIEPVEPVEVPVDMNEIEVPGIDISPTPDTIGVPGSEAIDFTE